MPVEAVAVDGEHEFLGMPLREPFALISGDTGTGLEVATIWRRNSTTYNKGAERLVKGVAVIR